MGKDSVIVKEGYPKGDTPLHIDKPTLLRWRSDLQKYMKDHGSLYAVSDTETTGTQIVEESTRQFNRVLEWSMCFCYEKDGFLYPCLDEKKEPIVIDEPVNPFLGNGPKNIKQKRSVKSISQKKFPGNKRSSEEVHGITMDYLFGTAEGALNRPQLKGVAASFDTVLDTVQSLLSFPEYKDEGSPVFLVFHNAPFDVRFLNHECETWELPHIESFFGVIDTLEIAKRVIPKSELPDKRLDDIYAFGKNNYPELISEIERPVHSALIDSMILVQCYNILVKYHQDKSSES